MSIPRWSWYDIMVLLLGITWIKLGSCFLVFFFCFLVVQDLCRDGNWTFRIQKLLIVDGFYLKRSWIILFSTIYFLLGRFSPNVHLHVSCLTLFASGLKIYVYFWFGMCKPIVLLLMFLFYVKSKCHNEYTYRVFRNEGQTESGSNLINFWSEILPKVFKVITTSIRFDP